MRKNLLKTSLTSLALLASLTISSQAFADAPIRQGGNFGIGIGGGTGTTGLSMKYFMSDAQALQFGLGFSIPGSYIGASLDYLLEIPTFVQTSVLDIGPSIGVGAGLGVGNGFLGVGINGVAGLEFLLNPVPIDFVIEWRPGLNIIPDPNFSLLGAAGHIRYYF